ncbi:hypothetical protein IHQ68_10920 [Chelatococcus sambhunathii]|uniref:Integral membrane protein (DUF2282) n=1 Tax=Chelatococcus sambhunathii TaxID=363953 RepID=A0ABU1DGF2_9HYPH|nr:hypothetical protein [Chelatococcus sambhunathii]MDR4307131.1 hypothetical protein [Chelatococcus sambhunathii]
MKMNVISGASVAAAAASLILAGAVMVPVANAKDAKMGHCMGANACKGQSACKTAKNACKGQNSCKGHGFTETTKADCAKAGGKYEPA